MRNGCNLSKPHYGTVPSNLLAEEPLPTLNKVYLTLDHEERMKIITCAKEERGEAIGLAIQTNTGSKGHGETNDKVMVYSNCNRTSHDSTSCL